jgi:predicted RNase H-like nuclease (RuvC/YqgF family)
MDDADTAQLRLEILRLKGELRYQKAIVDLHDHAEELQELRAKVRHLENVNQSLRTEIRTQRNEIALLREERRTLLEWDNPFPKSDIPADSSAMEASPAWKT